MLEYSALWVYDILPIMEFVCHGFDDKNHAKQPFVRSVAGGYT